MNVANIWKTYKVKIVPETACATQVTETEKAFYAGGVAVLSLILAGCDLEHIEDELLNFAALSGIDNATVN